MLSVDNTSPDTDVFIMAGDVVKGGKQDRAIAYDLIIPSKSGNLPLPSFCVEAGRWRKRGAEADGQFGCSDSQICSRGLKVALNESRQQGEVWKEVAEAQKKLSDNVGKQVNAASSPTSLQLALEDKDLKEKLAGYDRALAGVIKDKKDVVGVVVVINGEVSGAESFCSAELFGKLWPKLLKSATAEALAEFRADKKFEVPDAGKVTAFLADAAKGEAKEVEMPAATAGTGATRTGRNNDNATATQQSDNPGDTGKVSGPNAAAKVRTLKYTNEKSLLLECQEKGRPTAWVHRCYIAKDPPKPQKEADKDAQKEAPRQGRQ
jgi:hypothetical protein